MTAIELHNVTKVYRRFGRRHFATLKSALMQRSILTELQPHETFAALSDLSIRVPAGSTFGLVGRNGSGKSTALKLVAGITKPTMGTVAVKGRISALIAHVGVWNAFSLRNLTAPACLSRAIGLKSRPCWPMFFCCELNPPTIAAT